MGQACLTRFSLKCTQPYQKVRPKTKLPLVTFKVSLPSLLTGPIWYANAETNQWGLIICELMWQHFRSSETCASTCSANGGSLKQFHLLMMVDNSNIFPHHGWLQVSVQLGWCHRHRRSWGPWMRTHCCWLSAFWPPARVLFQMDLYYSWTACIAGEMIAQPLLVPARLLLETLNPQLALMEIQMRNGRCEMAPRSCSHTTRGGGFSLGSHDGLLSHVYIFLQCSHCRYREA